MVVIWPARVRAFVLVILRCVESVARQVAASEMLRLRWNPFYAFVEARVLEFIGLDEPQESGKML
jgi:hypothetical protein